MSPEDFLPAGADGDGTRSRLFAAAGKVRHAALVLGNFTTEVAAVSGDEDDDELTDDPDADHSVPEEEREPARLRRAALLVAALDIVDWCIDDLQASAFGLNGLPDPENAEGSFVYEWFPERHRGAYDEVFFRKVMVTAVKVAADLADPDGGPACCTAEEIVRHAAGAISGKPCEQAGLGRPWLDPDEMLLEDVDFEFLYDDDMDGLEADLGAQAALGVDLSPVQDWFSPFNSDRSVHPYAETPPTAPEVHDLRRRFREGDSSGDVLVTEVVDAAAPLASFAAGSEVVALARQAAADVGGGRWVADDSDRERSFAALARAASGGGSGWLEWEPYQGADTIRAQPVIFLAPHRHFPVGDDEPWVDAAIGAGHMLAIPLRFVVSYRPDPRARQLWAQRASNPLGLEPADRGHRRLRGEPQHFLNFFPMPHGHGALRPTVTARPGRPDDCPFSARITSGNRSSGRPSSPKSIVVVSRSAAGPSSSSARSRRRDTVTVRALCRSRLACRPNSAASPGRPVPRHRSCSRCATQSRSRTSGAEYPRRRSSSARP
jgi:hypothetical protein